MKEELHILMLEDNSLDAELNIEQLALLEEYNCIVKIIQDKEEYFKEITSKPSPDVILCDYNLPQYNGMDALHDLKSLNLMIPFVFVTGTMQEEIAADAIKAGAWDYVVKDRLFRLPLAVRGVLQLKKEKLLAIEADRKTQRLIRGIEETSVQVIVLDSDYLVDYVNINFTKVTGLQPEAVVGESFLSVIGEENPKLRDRIRGILKSQEVYKGDEKVYHNNGVTSWQHISITPIHDTEGTVGSYILVIEDITKQKEAEGELKQSLEDLHQLYKELEISKKKAEESDNLKTAFLANMSHEVRTPMNAIIGFSNLLEEEDLSRDERLRYIELIKSNGDTLLALINDILDISLIEADQIKLTKEIFCIDKVLRDIYCYFKLKAGKKVNLTYCNESSSEEVLVNTDPLRFKQILNNLLSNALKYTDQGSIKFGYLIKEGQAEIFVEDEGRGIDKEVQDQIFNYFYKIESEKDSIFRGTGIGLSICNKLASMMESKIFLESEPGIGSKFFFHLPLSEAGNTAINQHIPKTNSRCFKDLQILIAEDEDDNYILIERYFANTGVKLFRAKNGQEAVKICRQIHEKDPNLLILMDIKMPVMNGIEAFEQIREFLPEIPVIALTAYAHPAEKELLLDNCFRDYISKPVSRKKLFEIIRSHTG